MPLWIRAMGRSNRLVGDGVHELGVLHSNKAVSDLGDLLGLFTSALHPKLVELTTGIQLGH